MTIKEVNATDMIDTLNEIAHAHAIAEYKAEKYRLYMLAQERYEETHNFSDLLDMLDNGIATDMYTQEELKQIIAKQDELSQRILLAQYGKYLIMK